MKENKLACLAAIIAVSISSSVVDAEIIILDQIGESPSSLAGSSSSSMFNPGTPEYGGVTMDNFAIDGSPFGDASSMRITSIEAVVAGLWDFVSWDLVDSWSVQIYSSVDAAKHTVIGDVYSQSFTEPSTLKLGYDNLYDDALASFNVDFVLDPGEYWLSVVMGNEYDLNGVVGIRHSQLGDGQSWLVSSPGGESAKVNASAYRIKGTVVPAPSAWVALALVGVVRRRRRG